MRSPVVFQPLEKELKPVCRHLQGRVLNAGCGERDITAFLIQNGATWVDNCDRKTRIPNAISCDLSELPQPSNTYDSILCNAVLGHVQNPDVVMHELYRVLKPGGVLVISIPFLQPYHPSPDYRRYSREGMVELSLAHDFIIEKVLPVHGLPQTITWIAWCYMSERRWRTLQALLWLPFYLWTKLCNKTDFKVQHQANGYQIVLRKPAERCVVTSLIHENLLPVQ